MERKVIVIVGPTASGKTNLAVKTAKKLSSEIISADSRQIFKFLNIGTAKPGREELNTVKHHFISTLNPDEYYNVSSFEQSSMQVIENMFASGKIPVVAGGSGLYIKAIVDGIFESGETNDFDYRDKLLELRRKHGNEYLYAELKKIDPVSAENMLPQNWKRVIRALEVYRSTGEPIWKIQEKANPGRDIEFLQFGLNWDRAELYERIEQRVDLMIEAGLVEETKSILDMGYSKELNSLNTVGYKEIIEYLDGKISLERAVELIKRNTRRFAKRQLTWFRKDQSIQWLNIDSNISFDELADFIISEL